MTQIFISHSTHASTAFGLHLKSFLEFVLGDNVKAWISADIKDLPQGTGEHKRIVAAARASKVCVSILTPENYRRPWILFEPGIFYADENKEIIMILCGGLRHNHLQSQGYPLEGYASYVAEEQLKNLVISLNGVMDAPRTEKLLNEAFEFKKGEIQKAYMELFSGDKSSLVEADRKIEIDVSNSDV